MHLQMLISGGLQGLDIADMRANVQYSGGYHNVSPPALLFILATIHSHSKIPSQPESQDHPVIHAFWQALATFTPQEQADFLRFVTSCPRPPLLGFRYLEPPLAIQAGALRDLPLGCSPTTHPPFPCQCSLPGACLMNVHLTVCQPRLRA